MRLETIAVNSSVFSVANRDHIASVCTLTCVSSVLSQGECTCSFLTNFCGGVHCSVVRKLRLKTIIEDRGLKSKALFLPQNYIFLFLNNPTGEGSSSPVGFMPPCNSCLCSTNSLALSALTAETNLQSILQKSAEKTANKLTTYCEISNCGLIKSFQL